MLVILLYAVTFAYPPGERTTYGALALAFLGLSSTLPTLATAFFAGALADRHDRGTLMRVVNLLSILAVAGIAVDFAFQPAYRVSLPGPAGFFVPLWVLLLYPGWALVTVTATLFRPAYNSSVARLATTKDLGTANGVIYAVAAGASAAGTLAVGVVLTVVPTIDALAIPFVLFFSTQVALLILDVDLSVSRTSPPRAVSTEVRAGFVYLIRRRALFEATVAMLVVNFLSAVALVELGLYVASWLNLVAGVWFGAMVAVMTLGGALGFVLVSRFRFEHRGGRLTIVLTLAMGLALLALGLVRSIWLALPIVFVYGMMPGMIYTIFLSTVQATVPDEMMGRVFAADEVGSYALVPFGQSAGGALTVEVGVQGTYLTAGGALAAFGLAMAASFGALRRMGYQPHGPAEAETRTAS